MVRRKIGSILLVLLFILSFTFTSFAQIDLNPIKPNRENIKISGKTDYNNKPVVVQISDGKKKAYFDQGMTDEDGDFKFESELDYNGDYNGYVLIEGEKETFAFQTEKEIVIEEKKTNAEKIKEAVDRLRKYYENKDTLDFKEAIGYYHTSEDLDNGISTIKSKYKENMDINYATDYAGNIIGSIASGLNPKDYDGGKYVNTLLKAQKPSGIFEIDNEGGQSTQTAWSMISLHMANAKYNEEAAVKALIEMQNQSGSFGSIDHTAMCIMALENHENIDGVIESINKAKQYLLENKKNIIEKENVYTIATVIQGLVSIGENPLSDKWTNDDKTMLSALMKSERQGTFGYDTANEQAFMALADLYKKESMFTKATITDEGFGNLFVEQKNSETDNTKPDPNVPEKKPTVTITIEGYKGTILSDKVIEIKKGENLYAVTKRAVGGNIYKKPDGFVDSIYGQRTRDKGPNSGWMVHVDNKQIDTAAENYDLKGGERIYWFYTLDYRTDTRNTDRPKVEIKDEVQNKIDKAKNILGNKNVSEKDIRKAIKDVSSKLNEKAQKINSEKDAKDFVKDVKNISEVMNKAVDKVDTEEGAKDLARENINVVKTLVKSAEKLNKDSDKKQVSEAAAENMKITLKAMDKIKGEEARKIAGDVIESAGSLIKKLGKENIKEIKEKAVQMAAKAVEKASTQKIEKGQLKVEDNKAMAKIDGNNVKDLAKAVVNTAKDMKEKLKKNNMESNEEFETKLTIEIVDSGKKEVETNLPSNIMETLKENGIKKVAIKTEVASFNVTTKTFGDKAIGKEISLIAKIVDRSELSGFEKHKLSEDSIVVDLNAKVGQEKVTQFIEPITISVPYEGVIKEGEKVEVFYLKDDGTIESMGGEYDPITKTVTFKTSHFSKYFAKQVDKEGEKVFTDLKGYDWANEAIETMADKGIINGRTDKAFDPDASITRAEFATLVTKMMGYSTENMNVSFTDIAKDAWYYNYVGAAYKNGLINGRSESTFDPNGNITREEMAVIVAKVLEQKGYDKVHLDKVNIFKDTENISSWAKDSVSLCTKEEIISGMGNGRFAPKENANRAQAAVILYKLYNLIVK